MVTLKRKHYKRNWCWKKPHTLSQKNDGNGLSKKKKNASHHITEMVTHLKRHHITEIANKKKNTYYHWNCC